MPAINLNEKRIASELKRSGKGFVLPSSYTNESPMQVEPAGSPAQVVSWRVDTSIYEKSGHRSRYPTQVLRYGPLSPRF